MALGTRYIDGIILPVSPATKEAYVAMTRTVSATFTKIGAIRVVETWGSDVPAGKTTDYASAGHAAGDDVVSILGSNGRPSPPDAGMPKIMAAARMQTARADLTFDGKPMIYGDFTTLLDA